LISIPSAVGYLLELTKLNLPGLMNAFPGPPQSNRLSRSCGSPIVEINIIEGIVNKETEERVESVNVQPKLQYCDVKKGK